MVETKTEPTLRGDLHHVESDEFDFMIALYERALEAGHETDCGKIQEGLHWVEVRCTEEEFNTIFQQAREEADTTWQRQPMKKAA